MVRPLRAPVIPRITSPETGDALPLDEFIESLVGERRRGAVEVVGDRGAGKTTALDHLAAVLSPSEEIAILDDADVNWVAAQAKVRLVIFSSPTPHPSLADASVRLAPWSDDELLEYLMAVHPQRCGSVMGRLPLLEDRHLIGGAPALWRVVLDRMAGDESITIARDALAAECDELLSDSRRRELAGFYCLGVLLDKAEAAQAKLRQLVARERDQSLLPLLRYRPVQVLIAAQRVYSALTMKGKPKVLRNVLPRDLVEEVGRRVAASDHVMRRLEQLIRCAISRYQPMAASILHAANVGWSPRDARVSNLSRAHLQDAAWPGIDLSGVDMVLADLARADLTGATLDRAQLAGTCLRRARLSGASLNEAIAIGADLTHADLTRVRARGMGFNHARAQQADLSGASLDGTSWQDADLSGAKFCEARLLFANLQEATISGADFSNANLEGARLSGLPLREARLTGARFRRAHLRRCDLELVQLPEADFEKADLGGALLTGSVMPRSNFRGADLRGAGLAEIHWEEADLRMADLRGSTFHMGSSRSGLVGSPYACEGSRTGFYTDDYDEQSFKAPEEIRKANLCGADLRGANVKDVDFYLVDLRGAKYDGEQAEHFRRCGAILESRVM